MILKDNSSQGPLPPEADDDPFKPPPEAVKVECIHCGNQYSSDQIVWRASPDGKGFWVCPIEGCDGAGFGFDILPLDSGFFDPDDEDEQGQSPDESGEELN